MGCCGNDFLFCFSFIEDQKKRDWRKKDIETCFGFEGM